MADKLKVVITDNQKEVKVETGIRILLRRCCHAILENENYQGSAEIGITFTDNSQLQRLSTQYLGEKSKKEILAVPAAKTDEQEKCAADDTYLGNVHISFEKAVEEAEKQNHSVRRQVVYLTALGVLELLGYSYDNEAQSKYVRQRVELAMYQLGFRVSSSYYLNE